MACLTFLPPCNTSNMTRPSASQRTSLISAACSWVHCSGLAPFASETQTSGVPRTRRYECKPSSSRSPNRKSIQPCSGDNSFRPPGGNGHAITEDEVLSPDGRRQNAPCIDEQTVPWRVGDGGVPARLADARQRLRLSIFYPGRDPRQPVGMNAAGGKHEFAPVDSPGWAGVPPSRRKSSSGTSRP